MFTKLIKRIAAAVLLAAFSAGFAVPLSAGAPKPYNSAQLKYLFTGSEIEGGEGNCGGEGISAGVGSLGETFNFVMKFQDSDVFSVNIVCGTGYLGWNEKGSGTWKIVNNEICLNAPSDIQFWRLLSGENCWKIIPWKFGFAALDSKGKEDWRMSLASHPEHSSKEDMYAALKPMRSETDIAAQTRQTASAAPNRSISEAASDSAAWEGIKYSTRISDFQNYLASFPNGMFVKLAESQMRALIQRQADPEAAKKQFAGIAFGNYHALVIGINDYKYLPKLKTAVRDAQAVASLLKKEYGFKVNVMIDPERADIVDALDEYREALSPEDNLLIYYAGHGWLDEDTDEGYWLTRSAKKNRRSRWVSNAVITNSLKALSAKHVMVVADSCYSGTLTRSAAVGFRDKDYYRRMAAKQARVAMVSGGLEPVADDDGKGNSPFATAFLDSLRSNDSVIDGTRLFSEIRRPVILNANQTPEYSDVRHAGHDGGDFLFVRKK